MDVENKYGTLEMQKELLILLKRFHAFCVKNEINYSLDWGSLLGAIRHKGFIPWDDDLDIMMDRSNYYKLQSVISEEKGLVYDNTSPETIWVSRIFLSESCQNDGWQPTIDVFIIDNAPDGLISRKIRLYEILFMQGMTKVRPNFKKGNALMRVCTVLTYYLGKFFPRETKLRWYDAIAQGSNKKETKQKTCYFEEIKCLGRYYPTNLLDSVITVPFEDVEVNVVKDYHQCLCEQFGVDYMTPPPLNERVPRHS